jgi:hypothetical protein
MAEALKKFPRYKFTNDDKSNAEERKIKRKV